jgi:hypothetical protein
MWVSLIGAFVFLGLTFWKRKSYPTNLLFLAGFTLMEAYSISVVIAFTDNHIVLQAVMFTLGIFVALSLFACQTKYDFTHWAPYLFGALWVLILFGFMSAFFPKTSNMELGYGVVTALIFSGYILVSLSSMKIHWSNSAHSQPPGRHAADHAPLPRGGGDCGGHLAVPRHHQPLPRDSEDPQLAEQQLAPGRILHGGHAWGTCTVYTGRLGTVSSLGLDWMAWLASWGVWGDGAFFVCAVGISVVGCTIVHGSSTTRSARSTGMRRHCMAA